MVVVVVGGGAKIEEREFEITCRGTVCEGEILIQF